MSRHDSILGAVDNTSVVRINTLGPEGIDLFVKVVAFNPMGSVKDRLALAVIEDAEQSGALEPAQTVIEATISNLTSCRDAGYPDDWTCLEQGNFGGTCVYTP